MGDASRIRIVTEPGLVYRQESFESGHLLGILAGLETRHDLMSKSDEADVQTGEVEPLTGRLFARHRDRLFEMALQRQVDQYLTYLSHLIALLFRSRPETLHAGPPGRQAETEAVSLDVILQHATMEDLLNTVVERRVENLAYKGMGELADYLGQRLGFDLFASDDQRHMAVLVVEVRNIITHNRAVVNDTFVRRVKESPWAVGQRIELDFQTHSGFMAFLESTAADIDRRAIEKWALPTIRIEIPETGPAHRVDAAERTET
ncbi:MAG TPA: hypothetical protein VIL92_10195 [Gaiellaceae bacterium]